MKKNFFVGFIALTALTVTSCSNDDVVMQSPEVNKAIEFGTYPRKLPHMIIRLSSPTTSRPPLPANSAQHKSAHITMPTAAMPTSC